MSTRERRRVLAPDHQGLVIAPDARLSRAESYRNLVLVAPTGSGKTTRYVVPNVLLASGSVVVTDPSGEIYDQTAGHLVERGYRLQVLQPAHPERSLGFNPLALWRSPQQLRRLAAILAANVAGTNSNPFWAVSATNVLFFALTALSHVSQDEFVHLGNLRELLNHLDAEDDGARSFMERHLGTQERTLGEYRAFRGMEGRVRASVLATARAALDLWSDPLVSRVTAEHSLDIAALRRELTAIYVILPEHQVRYFGVLANLFYSTCFEHCLVTGRAPADLPVFFFLDEFGNLGPIEDIATVVTTLRKRRCSVSLIVQELSQVRSVYGPDLAQTIVSGGAANKLFYSGLDLETALYVEQVLGQNTEYDTTFGGIDEQARTIATPLLRADEVRRLPRDEAILVSGRERPAKIIVPPAFSLPSLRPFLQKPAPPFPQGKNGEPAWLGFGADQ